MGKEMNQEIDNQIAVIQDCIERSVAQHLKSTVTNIKESFTYSAPIKYYIQSLTEIRHTINPEKRLVLYREKLSPLIENPENGLRSLGIDFNSGRMRKFVFSSEQMEKLKQALNALEIAQAQLNTLTQKPTLPISNTTEPVELPIRTVQDQPTIERLVDENGHPVITAKIFQDYANARIEAARALNGNTEKLDNLAQKIPKLFHEDDFAAFKEAKTHKEQMIKKATRWFKDNEIDKATYQSTCIEAERLYKTAFDRAYNANMTKLQQVSRLLADAVNPKKDPVSVIKLISKKADDLRALQARPKLSHTYQIKQLVVNSSHIPEGWLTKEQQALYRQVHGNEPPTNRPYTGPSTIRDKRQVGQANAVRSEIAINGNTVFVGHRHGSPSVLKINNDAQRQHRTLQNVKQSLTQAAQAKIAKLGNGNLPDPLVVEMATMSLLSPVMKGDLLDGMKQYRQVDDSRNAYWSLHGRTIPLEVTGNDGKLRTINVQLDSTFMSVGVNAVRGVGTLAARELVQKINNRGLDQLIMHFLKQTDGIADGQLKRLGNRLKEMESMPLIKECKDNITLFNRQNLNDAYEKLEYCNRALSDPEHKTMINSKIIKKERKQVLKTIEKEEKKLDKLYNKLANARESLYQDRIKDFKNILVEMKATNNYQGNKDFQKFQIFVDAVDIYFNQPRPGLSRFLAVKSKTSERNKILKKMAKEDSWDKKDILREQANMLQEQIDALNKSNYRFQARFAMLASYMDQFVEWFCKSGEDRTGLLNEHIEGFCLFIEKYGYAPSWDNKEDYDKFHKLMPLVHNGAPNRETNAFNDDCPGLKVSDPDFDMPTVSYYTDKKVANISKTATSIAPSIKEKVKQFFSRLIGSESTRDGTLAAQSQIDKIAQTRQGVYEYVGLSESISLPKVDTDRSLTAGNTYTPGAKVKVNKEPKTNGPQDKSAPQKGHRKSTKF
jgi:hypothetical protein